MTHRSERLKQKNHCFFSRMASSMTSYNPVESYSPHHSHPSASSYVTNSPLSAALANAKSAEYQTYYPYATSQRSKSLMSHLLIALLSQLFLLIVYLVKQSR